MTEEPVKITAEEMEDKATETKAGKENNNLPGLSGIEALGEMRKLFSHTYLAMLSIIQGVALHILIYHSMEYWTNISEYGYTFIIYFFINLEILCLIWFEYVYIVQFPRIANWKDTVYPISLGVLQICLTYTITYPQKWLMFVIPTGVIGYLAFRNTRTSLRRCRGEFQSYIADYIDDIHRKKEAGMILSTFSMAIVLVIYHFSPSGIYVLITGSNPINILDVIIFIFLSYFTFINFHISNRIEKDFKELDKNNLYEAKRLKADIFFLEAAMNRISRLASSK